MKFDPVDVVLVCGNHTNAHTIVRSLDVIGFQGKVVLLRIECDPVLVADRLNPWIEQWVISEEEAGELPEIVSRRWAGIAGRVFVCFTNERFHQLFSRWVKDSVDDNIIVNFGNVERISTIIDRFRLYQFIEDNGFASVPDTIAGTEDPFEVFGDEFVIRPRESWQTPVHREEVKISKGKSSYEDILKGFESRGVGREKLCFQELLSIKNESSLAIGGWFDPENQHLFCLRKRFQHPPGVGSGDICERIEPPDGVMESAVSILSALEYCGPFELEFVFDDKSGEYKVIEMNPRFWMQHGLPEILSGYALISRYLGRRPQIISPSELRTKYWVNPVQCLYRAIKGSFMPLFYYFRRDSWAPYTLLQAMWYGPLHVYSKLTGKR